MNKENQLHNWLIQVYLDKPRFIWTNLGLFVETNLGLFVETNLGLFVETNLGLFAQTAMKTV